MSLTTQLSQLEASQLVRRLGDEEASYIFRHGLAQETAYESLLSKKRREIHLCVAKSYEEIYAADLDPHAALLAHHFAVAGEDRKTLEYGARAGDVAAGVYANAEAVANYSLAIKSAERLESTTPEQLVQLYAKRGRALELLGQDHAALQTYERLEMLSRERHEPRLELGSLVMRSKLYSLHTAVHDSARGDTLSQQALRLAEEMGNRVAQVEILWNLSLASQWGVRGPRAAVEYGEQALALARELGLREPLAYVLGDLAYPYLYIGQADRSRTLRQEANEVWRELDNKPMIADNLTGLANVYLITGEVESAVAGAREAYALSESIGNEWGQGYSQGILGNALLELAQWDDAVETLHGALGHARKGGAIGPIIASSTFLAELYSLIGENQDALQWARSAHAEAEAHLREWLAWTEATLARVCLAMGDLDGAGAAVAALPQTIEEILDRVWVRGAIHAIIAKIEFALAKGDLLQARAIAERLLYLVSQRGLRLFHADVLFLIGKIHSAQGNPEEAAKHLYQARDYARQINSRRALFSILISLEQFELASSNSGKAERVRAEAHELIKYILAHMRRPDLRTPFLKHRAVRTILEADGTPL